MATDTYNGLDPHQRAFIKLVKENAHRHRCYEVFRDFCELAALSFSNAVDQQQFEAREARYLEIVKGYSEDEVNRFPAMLAEFDGLAYRSLSRCARRDFHGARSREPLARPVFHALLGRLAHGSYDDARCRRAHRARGLHYPVRAGGRRWCDGDRRG